MTMQSELTARHPTGSAMLDLVRTRRRRLGEVLSDVEQAIAAPMPGRPGPWGERVAEVMAELQATFAEHIEVAECTGGLHDEIVWRSPRLVHEVERLQGEHQRITEAIIEMLDELEARSPLEEIGAKRTRYAALGLLGLISRHRQRGADLIFEAYTVDIGSGE